MQARRAGAALDQINFTIPTTAPLGCNVSVIVETMNGSTPVVSNNSPTISIGATDGATCSDPTQLFPSSITSKTSLKVFYVGVQVNVSINSGSSGKNHHTRQARGAWRNSFRPIRRRLRRSPVLNCRALTTSPVTAFATWDLTAIRAETVRGLSNTTILNAGTVLTLTPPSKPVIALTQQSDGTYQSGGGSNTLPSGTWTFSDGSGGSGVGPLNFSFPVPQQVTWSNETSLFNSTIVRTKPLTITWTGGDSNGYVDILGSTGVGIYYVGPEMHRPRPLRGSLTIPSSVLLSMRHGHPGGGLRGFHLMPIPAPAWVRSRASICR